MIKIVADIGVNHNGNMDNALLLMHHAKEAGVDAVKFQKRLPALSIPKCMWDEKRMTPWGERKYIEYKEDIEFNDYKPIDKQSKWLDILWFASAWDEPSVRYLESFDVPYHKVASACLTNDDLIIAMCKTGKTVILSTGMSTESEIRHAVNLLERYSNGYIICHCNSSYPCPVGDINLSRILTLKNMFPGVPVGYSGHEVGLATTIAAVALGVQYIERHITLDRAMWGTDQAASIEPQGFRRLVKDIRNVEKAMGNGMFAMTDLEKAKRLQLKGVYGQ